MKSVLGIIAPQYCIICIEKTRSINSLCEHCETFLPWLANNCCYSCSLPLLNSSSIYCGVCAVNKLTFNHTKCAFHYTNPIDKWIKQLKFKHKYNLAKILSTLLIKKLRLDGTYAHIDAIIPIPIHFKRWLTRGYNQSALIAKYVGKDLAIQVDYKLLSKIKHTQPQTKLNKKKRSKNIAGCFHAKKSNYKRVAIIDDVMTTRATAHTAAKALQKTGINYIEVWCIARSSW